MNFDLLIGEIEPTRMFGEILEGKNAELAKTSLEMLGAEARQRVAEIFEEVVDPNLEGIAKLDRIIKSMWQSGWSPERKSFNLFCTDFGALYCSAFLVVTEIEITFRSVSDVSHVSFWHALSNREFFPFHKVAKALRNSDGESLVQLFLEVSAQQGTSSDRVVPPVKWTP